MAPFHHISNIILIVIAFADLSIGLLVFLANKTSTVNRAFLAFVAGTSLWVLGVGLVFLTRQFVFNKLIFTGAVLMFAGLLAFAKVFPSGETPRRAFWLSLIPLVLLAALVPFDVFVKGIRILPDGAVEPVNGALMPFFAAVFAFYLVYISALLTKTYRASSGLAKRQLQYFLLGIVILFGSAVFFDAVLPAIHVFSLNLLGPASSSIFLALTAYAIVRHHLMDIRVVIQRGVIYWLLLSLITAFYLVSVFLIGILFAGAERVPILLAAGLTTLVGIFGAPVLENYFRRVTDQIFFKDQYDYSEALYKLSEILNQNIELDLLSRHMIQALTQIFKVRKAVLLLVPQNVFLEAGREWQTAGQKYLPTILGEIERRPEIILCSEISRQLPDPAMADGRRAVLQAMYGLAADHGVEAIVPLGAERRIVGVLLMGRKLSGDAYANTDLTLLKTFSHQAAIAIEKAKLYKQVKDHSLELESRVRDRTAQLQGLHEEQRRMMIEIAHALQTPLTVVKGELGLVERHVPSRRKIKAVEHSIDKVSKFIYDLLRLAKLESDEEEFRKDPVELSRLLRDTLEYVNVIAKEKHIRITSRIEPGLIVRGQQDKLEELLVNLISNAVKYTESSPHKEISVSLERAGECAAVSVADTGPGIDQEDIPHLFERFYRATSRAGTSAKGIGLGLAIAKKIAEKHGGTITAESTPGEGAKFVVTLPLDQKEL